MRSWPRARGPGGFRGEGTTGFRGWGSCLGRRAREGKQSARVVGSGGLWVWRGSHDCMRLWGLRSVVGAEGAPKPGAMSPHSGPAKKGGRLGRGQVGVNHLVLRDNGKRMVPPSRVKGGAALDPGARTWGRDSPAGQRVQPLHVSSDKATAHNAHPPSRQLSPIEYTHLASVHHNITSRRAGALVPHTPGT